MIEFLYSIDVSVFFFLNHTIANPVLDLVMPFLTDLNKQKPVLLLVVVWIALALWKGGRRGRSAIAVLAVTILLSDQLNSAVFKELFGRIRPCRALEGVRMLVDCGGGLSFPSSHAVNNFAGAFVISSFYRKQKLYWYVFASLVALSRPYVGVHYPSDILAGSIIGMAIGFVTVGAWNFLQKYFPQINLNNNN